VRNALILGGIGLACAAVAYLLLDGTAFGQAWSDQAYLGSHLQPDYARRMETAWLHLITPITTGLMCLVLIGIGIVRRIWLVGFIAAVGLGLATLISEALRMVLPHPDLATGYEALMDGKTYQTFPSGHATIATATTLGLLLVSGPNWRTPVAIVGTFATTLVAAGTVAATWHRPTDALGGIAIAFAVFSLAAWITVRWCGHWGGGLPVEHRDDPSQPVAGRCPGLGIPERDPDHRDHGCDRHRRLCLAVTGYRVPRSQRPGFVDVTFALSTTFRFPESPRPSPSTWSRG